MWSDRRKQEYFLAIANVLSMLPKNIKPIIVENSKDNESYLDVFNCDVVYTNDNSTLIDGDTILHKGTRELIDIRKVIEKFNIVDDAMVIKMTGRYLLFKPDFFTKVLDNPDKDAIFRPYNVCTYETGDTDIVLGLFALRCKFFKLFKYNDYDAGAEEDFRNMINQLVEPEKILLVDKLWLRVCLGSNHKLVDC
jgi:hypothetical protein